MCPSDFEVTYFVVQIIVLFAKENCILYCNLWHEKKKQVCIIFNNIFNRLRKIEEKKGSSGAELIEQCAVFLTVSSCKSSLCVLEMGLDLSWIMLQNKICYCNVKSTAVL